MKFTFADSDANLVRSYAPGRLVVAGQTRGDSVLLTARTLESWPVSTAVELTEEHFEAILAHRPEVVLLGTGAHQVMVPPRLYRRLAESGIGVEVMATDAAVRTFNVLVSEDRRVLGALIV